MERKAQQPPFLLALNALRALLVRQPDGKKLAESLDSISGLGSKSDKLTDVLDEVERVAPVSMITRTTTMKEAVLEAERVNTLYTGYAHAVSDREDHKKLNGAARDQSLLPPDDPRVIDQFIRSAVRDAIHSNVITASTLRDSVFDVASNVIAPLGICLFTGDQTRLELLEVEHCMERWVSKRLWFIRDKLLKARAVLHKGGGIKSFPPSERFKACEFLAFLDASVQYDNETKGGKEVITDARLLLEAKRIAAEVMICFWTTQEKLNTRLTEQEQVYRRLRDDAMKGFCRDHNGKNSRRLLLTQEHKGRSVWSETPRKPSFACEQFAELLENPWPFLATKFSVPGDLITGPIKSAVRNLRIDTGIEDKAVRPRVSTAAAAEEETGSPGLLSRRGFGIVPRAAENVVAAAAAAAMGADSGDAGDKKKSSSSSRVVEGYTPLFPNMQLRINRMKKKKKGARGGNRKKYMTMNSFTEFMNDSFIDIPQLYKFAQECLLPAFGAEGGVRGDNIPMRYAEIDNLINRTAAEAADKKNNSERSDQMPYKGLYWRTSKVAQATQLAEKIWQGMIAPPDANVTRWLNGVDESGQFVNMWARVPDDHKSAMMNHFQGWLSALRVVRNSAVLIDKKEIAGVAGLDIVNDIMALLSLGFAAHDAVGNPHLFSAEVKMRDVKGCIDSVRSLQEHCVDLMRKRSGLEAVAEHVRLDDTLVAAIQHNPRHALDLDVYTDIIFPLSTAAKSADETHGYTLDDIPAARPVQAASARDGTERKIKAPKLPFRLKDIPLETTRGVTIRSAIDHLRISIAPYFTSVSILQYRWHHTLKMLAKIGVECFAMAFAAELTEKTSSPTLLVRVVKATQKSLAELKQDLSHGCAKLKRPSNGSVVMGGVPFSALSAFIDKWARVVKRSKHVEEEGHWGMVLNIVGCAHDFARLAHCITVQVFPKTAPGIIDMRVFDEVFIDLFIRRVIPEWSDLLYSLELSIKVLIERSTADALVRRLTEDGRFIEKRDENGDPIGEPIKEFRAGCNWAVWTNSSSLVFGNGGGGGVQSVLRELMFFRADAPLPRSIRVLFALANAPWEAHKLLAGEEWKDLAEGVSVAQARRGRSRHDRTAPCKLIDLSLLKVFHRTEIDGDEWTSE